MKRIYLVRHATAIEKGAGLPDFERPLTKKGEKEATAIARHLARRYPVPDLMISSFANRAIDTAHLIAKGFGYPSLKILLRDTFYGDAKIDDLVREIVREPDHYRSLLLVGHDPAFSRLAAHLIRGFRETIPKSGVVVADLAIDRWADLKAGSGRLLEFAFPDRLKEEARKVRSDLEARLVRSMDGILSRVNKPVAAAMKDDTRKSAQRIVKEFIKTRKKGFPAQPGVRQTPPAN